VYLEVQNIFEVTSARFGSVRFNLRIHLECVDGRWRFVMHRNQAHCSARGYATAEEAVSEALVLNSILKIKTDSAERRQRRLESIKTHGPIVEAPSEATTQTTADDLNV
jgi:hypothetical protein